MSTVKNNQEINEILQSHTCGSVNNIKAKHDKR